MLCQGLIYGATKTVNIVIPSFLRVQFSHFGTNLHAKLYHSQLMYFLIHKRKKKDSSCEDEEFLLPSLLTFLCFLTAAIAEQIQRNFMAQTMSEEELKVHFKHTV